MPRAEAPEYAWFSDAPSPAEFQISRFGNIRLRTAREEGICKFFTGFSTESPVPRDEELLIQICDDLGPRDLLNFMITVSYIVYKKVRVFLNSHGDEMPATERPGRLITN